MAILRMTQGGSITYNTG